MQTAHRHAQYLPAQACRNNNRRQSLDGPSFCLSSRLCLCNSFHGYFVPNGLPSSCVSCVLQIVSCILSILSFWANIRLSVSAHHVSSFVIGLWWRTLVGFAEGGRGRRNKSSRPAWAITFIYGIFSAKYKNIKK